MLLNGCVAAWCVQPAAAAWLCVSLLLLLSPCAACVCLQASQFSRLPPAILTCILQLLPQWERLRNCATVCKSWAKAATAATVEVNVSLAPPSHASFEPWLEQHAGQLVSLRVVDNGWDPSMKTDFHLPLFKLQQLSRLDLQGLQVDSSLADSSSYTGAAPLLAKLQELSLYDCTLSCSTLLQQSQLAGVTQFKYAHPSDLEAVKHLLQGLPNLECLSLHISVNADVMQVLPAHSLTALTFWTRRGEAGTLSNPLVGLTDSASRLVNLRELTLAAELNPVALASMTLLTKLDLEFCDPASGVDGPSDFPEAVRGMRQLQHLEAMNDLRVLLSAAEPRACAALTAPAQLTCLSISDWQAQPLPATALQHMFPAGKQLPRLQHLVFDCHSDGLHGGRITAAELSSLVRACPGLTYLGLACVLAPDADLSALLKLPQQCQHLKVGGQAFGDNAAGVVAQLTQLTQLEWCRSGLTAAGLAQLTALHALDTLYLTHNNLSSHLTCLPFHMFCTKAGGQVRSKELSCSWHCCRQSQGAVAITAWPPSSCMRAGCAYLLARQAVCHTV
jgi:hypothetical protein